jgi:hypothetical protein
MGGFFNGGNKAGHRTITIFSLRQFYPLLA